MYTVMGKKSLIQKFLGKKSFVKKNRLASFMKNNRMVLATIVGAAAGAIIIRALGSERGKEMKQAVEGSIKTIGQKIMEGRQAAMLKMEKAS
jgi:hypothetical protein